MLMGVDQGMSQFQSGRANTGLAIDVAVTRPFNSHNLTCKAPCERYASSKKHAYYDEGFKGTAFEFAALIFETTGVLMKRVSGFYVSCSDLQPSIKAFSSAFTAVAHGHVCLAVYNHPFPNAFLIAQEVLRP